MLVLYSWLKEYIDCKLPPDELADRLTMSGTRVERVEKRSLGFNKVVVGQIKSIVDHPNAENLVVCEVNVGEEVLKIVCGAKNMKTGDKVAVALEGAKLPTGVTIKAAKIRDIVSYGMLCSEAELGLGEDSSGLLILKPEAQIGIELQTALDISDAVFEFEITPNRPDCLSVIGIAREVAAITAGKLRIPRPEIKESKRRIYEITSVKILDSELCPRYMARVIDGVKIGPSPSWMQKRLIASGFRPINNIVDITNYITLESGQPLHAFDLDKLKEKRIVVRRADAGEEIMTLDGMERQLGPEMLVIADADNPVALAGIMGGADSEVTEDTKTILLESAHFNPVSISRTSRQLGLSSEASLRFEKRIDPNGVIFAANRACELMQELAGGEVLQGLIDEYPVKTNPVTLSVRPEKANQVLGTNLSAHEMVEILERLGLSTKFQGSDHNMISVNIPTFRLDLEREIDLIEEIARIYGFQLIPSTLPASRARAGGLSRQQKIRRMIRDTLVGAKLREAITYSFINPKDLDRLKFPTEGIWRKVVRIKNPLSEEQSIMRTTMLHGLLTALTHNLSRDIYDVQLFEIGRVFISQKVDELPLEPVRIGAVLTGAWRSHVWYETPESINFFDMKGIIEALLEVLGIDEWELRSNDFPAFHPYRAAEVLIAGEKAGLMGELHPEVLNSYDLKARVYAFELDEDVLIRNSKRLPAYEEIPRFPGIPLDIALVVDEKIPAAKVEEIIQSEGGELLREVRIFDVYRGKQVPLGKKSLAYSLLYQAEDRTLTDLEVKKVQNRIVSRLQKELDAEIRS